MESRAGRIGNRRGFSDQCGESEISERSECNEASLERMTCHLETNEVTESEADRSSSRRLVIASRFPAGESGGVGAAESMVGLVRVTRA